MLSRTILDEFREALQPLTDGEAGDYDPLLKLIRRLGCRNLRAPPRRIRHGFRVSGVNGLSSPARPYSRTSYGTLVTAVRGRNMSTHLSRQAK
jgi:hypothetical protein